MWQGRDRVNALGRRRSAKSAGSWVHRHHQRADYAFNVAVSVLML